MSQGPRIRALRKEANLTQIELAKLADIDQSTLSAIERGAGFSADTLMSLAAALGVTAEMIMLGEDSRPLALPADLTAAIARLNGDRLERLEDVIRAHLGEKRTVTDAGLETSLARPVRTTGRKRSS